MKKLLNNRLILILCLCIISLSSCTNGQTPTEAPKAPETTVVEENKKNNENKEANIDETTGLEIESEDKLEYAKSLKLTRLKDGYILANMLDGDELVLLVPKDKEFLNLDGVTEVRYPVDNIGAYSTTHVALIKAIDHLEKVGSVNNDKEDWYIDGVSDLIEEGKIKFVGKSFDVDYELIQEANPDLIITSGGRSEKDDKMKDKLDELGLKNIAVYQHIEDDPRGRMEWVKFFGILVGDEDAANAYFDDQISRIAKIEEENKNLNVHPSIVNFRASQDGITVKREEDYSVRMLEMAGGTYGFKGIVEGGTGTYKISPEEFYKNAENVDILIHENMGKRVDTVDDLLAFGDYLVDLKAIKDGRIYTTNENYWQAMDKTAEMIEELNLIIKDEAPDEMTFYKKIK